MRAAADLAERFGSGALRTTHMQNLVVLDVPRERTAALAAEAEGGRTRALRVALPARHRGLHGTEFCKIALTETKGFARRLVEDLESRLPGFDRHVKIHVTGCPNSCGQHWIADIGLEGKKVKGPAGLEDAYYVCVGGGLGQHASVARPVGFRVPARETPAAIERLLRAYLDLRAPGQSFKDSRRPERRRLARAAGGRRGRGRRPRPSRGRHPSPPRMTGTREQSLSDLSRPRGSPLRGGGGWARGGDQGARPPRRRGSHHGGEPDAHAGAGRPRGGGSSRASGARVPPWRSRGWSPWPSRPRGTGR
jgi:hypothetical protein